MEATTLDFENAVKDLASATILTAQEFENGPKIDPVLVIQTYDSGVWETFIDEWIHSLKDEYFSVMRPTGPGDKGIDVAGFTDDKKLLGVWDNHQCKHYKNPLSFGVVAPEIGKILWHSFNGVYVAPRSCAFIAPKGPSTTLDLLLANSDNLKTEVIEKWQKMIADKITTTQSVELTGDFETYVNDFDFSIFSAPAPRSVIEAHKKTPYYPGRFGGGLPSRPVAESPPDEIEPHEIAYTKKLLDAYADHKSQSISCATDLNAWSNLKEHFGRSREAFYHAESLRVFVREKADPGTFESLQDEIYDGVADTCESDHADGYARVVAVTDSAQSLALDAHPLNKSALPKDRRGICHQLANDGRLTWKK
ncbi:ABC-three component system protein [Rhodophyticola porphyridii]|uniref:ABC-three component system protein n=1 Tax=Rhodophyticola porphyridii TaxID=1852017 RepID=UPI0018F314A6|nr:ABC-three component system protein [Rhodophyticola porphyridii]